MCGLFNGTTYYFAANGRSNGGPGGSSSPTINATPYNASATWTAIPTPTNGVPSSTNLYGVGYTSLTTCSNNATSATGSFAAVGAGGAIFTSADGKSWINQPAPSGFTTDLNAVTGYAANQNNPVTPALRWVAVGAGGAYVYSLDGLGWIVGSTPGSVENPNTQTLHSITQVAGTFFAVGDAGTIISSPDEINWTTHNSPSVSISNLNGVTHGGIYVAVGDGGTILISGDGNTWAVKIPTPSIPSNINLRQVTYFASSYGSIYVAVGDAGTIVTSKDGGVTWITQTAPTGSNLVGIAAETQLVYVATPVADPSLLFISTAQFVAVDNTGNAYTSPNGYTWTSVPVSTGTTTSTGISNLSNLGQPMVSSGFGYVTVGNAGATASAF
jgi:hypothetical protein